MRYPVEPFTPEERALLEPSLHEPRPAGLLPRQPPRDDQGGDVRPLLALPGHAATAVPRRVRRRRARAATRPFDGVEGERAAGLYERVFIGYGDDSIAQVGGAHVACEWVSNVLTKVLQRGRLAAYLEQSTRYIPYDQPMPEGGGGYRYYRDERAGRAYRGRMDELFGIYSRSLEAVQSWAAERWPRGDEPEARVAALDPRQGARPAAGLLPASTLSHVGIFASGPGLRAAAAAPDGLAAAGGARVRGDDADRARQGDPELRRAGRPSRSRRRVDRLPARAPARRPSARWRGWGWTARDERRALGRAGRRRGRRGGPARGLAVRVGAAARRPRSATGSRPSTRWSAPS